MFLREKHDCLEREVLQHRQEVTSLQEKLDSVTKVKFAVLGSNLIHKQNLRPDIQIIRICISIYLHIMSIYSPYSPYILFLVLYQEFDMSVDDLSETLLQIKVRC